MEPVTDRERRLVAALAADPVYNTDHQLELAFGPRTGRVVAEMRRAVRDYDAENKRIDGVIEAKMREDYPGMWEKLEEQIRSDPTSAIRFLVDRMHVGRADSEVWEDISNRALNGGADARTAKAWADAAVAIHHENQRVYRLVTGSLT